MSDLNVPKVRFRGFTDPWEQRKFRELLDTKDGLRRGPFGSALKKEIFIPESDYVVYEQQNAIYDRFDTRYNITKEKFDELHRFHLVPNDFILSGSGTIGRISRVPEGIKQGVFNQALIRFRINDETTDSDFFLQWIRSENIQRKLTGANPGSAITNLVPMSEVKGWEVSVPSKIEQHKLGEFFTDFEHIIALHQNKLDQLKELKKLLMQKIFDQEWRFKGFTDPWEQRKLNQITERVQGNDGRMNLPTLTISAGSGWMSQEERFSSNIAGKEQKKYTLLKKGQLSYNHGNSKLAKYGAVFELQDYEEALVPRVYHSFKIKHGSAGFIDYLFSTKKLDRELRKLISSGARMDGLLNINYGDFSNIEFFVPDEQEQNIICIFLRTIDKGIALHQNKLDQLKNLKKWLMQKMFI